MSGGVAAWYRDAGVPRMADDRSSVCLAESEAVAYATAVADEKARSRVEAHLDGCDECRWLVSELARTQPAGPELREVGRYRITERLRRGGGGGGGGGHQP